MLSLLVRWSYPLIHMSSSYGLQEQCAVNVVDTNNLDNWLKTCLQVTPYNIKQMIKFIYKCTLNDSGMPE